MTMNKVPGEGPVPCDLMVIGEGPGKDEDRSGRPFVGKSGKELNRYLWTKCQRTRTSVYITNLVKYRTDESDSDPTAEDIARDEPELISEIRRVAPKVIASVGRWSTRWLLGDVDMDAVHGVAHKHDGIVVVPCIHPAAGLHNTEFQAKIAWDFGQLGKVLKYWEGKSEDPGIWALDDEHPAPDYQDVPKKYGAVITKPAAVDTEGSISKPWGLSLCTSPGVALNLRWGGVRFKDRVIMHSALHDLPVLAAMGIVIGDDQFDDTMIKAYLLCVEPQGLKNLCRRHCGMEMKDYEEVLGGAQRRHNEQWLSKLLSSESLQLAATTRKKAPKKSISASVGKKSRKISLTSARR